MCGSGVGSSSANGDGSVWECCCVLAVAEGWWSAFLRIGCAVALAGLLLDVACVLGQSVARFISLPLA